MRAQNWSDVMTLLGVMVAAGKMDKKAERAIFEQAATNLRDLFAPNIMLTESFAADWLAENRNEINRKTSSVLFDSSVKALQKNLDSLPNKSEILTTIMKWTLSETPSGTQGQLRFKAEPEDVLSAAWYNQFSSLQGSSL